ncbi:MAG: hypothetical protein LC624_10840, partial [Halobacteriales archaeon]|nr:hypothetical protein [Halobacteriales archaeon]
MPGVALRLGHVQAVDEEEVEVAVAVDVEPARARAAHLHAEGLRRGVAEEAGVEVRGEGGVVHLAVQGAAHRRRVAMALADEADARRGEEQHDGEGGAGRRSHARRTASPALNASLESMAARCIAPRFLAAGRARPRGATSSCVVRRRRTAPVSRG